MIDTAKGSPLTGEQGSFVRGILWVFVVVLAIGVGAGLYEARVIMPLWAASPPESVWGWRDLLAANPQHAPHGGDRFWIIVSPLRALLALVVVGTAFRARGSQRAWRLVAGGITLLLFAVAVAWLIPTSAELFAVDSERLGADVVAAKTKAWVMLNYGFQVLGLVAFLAAVKALVLAAPPSPGG